MRLIVLLAVLLMPIEMAPAAAAPHHAVAASMAMNHCPDGSGHESNAGMVDCAMACAAALPASEMARADPPLITPEPASAAIAEPLHGFHPETATPPPRRS